MQITSALAVITGFIAFVVFLRRLHGHEISSDHTVSKAYVDGKTIEFENSEVTVEGQKQFDIQIGHFEEFVEVLIRCVKHKSIFENINVHHALLNFIKHPSILKYIRKESFIHEEETPYRAELQYGGCYLINSDNCGIVHAIGSAPAILALTSSVHDKEEILRVSQKWEKQNYTVVAIATADVKSDKKNILTRGVKEKMTFLGLLAIKKT